MSTDPSSKGKGKARSDAASSTSSAAPPPSQPPPQQAGRSTFSLPIPTARDLAGILSSGGKAAPGIATGGGVAAHEWSADARATAAAAGGEAYACAGGSFRSVEAASSTQGGGGLDSDFQAFQQQAQPGESAAVVDGQRQRVDLSPALLVGPYATATALDPAFHASVRNESRLQHASATSDSETQAFEAAWQSSASGSASTQEEEMQSTWARTRAAQAPSLEAEAEASDDFMAALAMDEQLPAPMSAPAPTLPSSSLPPGLTTIWRPPTPSRAGEMTLEQLKLHQELALAQDDELRTLPAPSSASTSTADKHLNALGSRAAQALVPPKDDREAGTGVYASTPERAFEAIWDGAGTAERAREKHEQGSLTVGEIDEGEELGRRAERVVKQVVQWIARGTYVDDVYGLPPLLARTLAEAEQPASEDPTAEAMRLRAVERLEALTRHLSLASTSHTQTQGVGEAEEWLRGME